MAIAHGSEVQGVANTGTAGSNYDTSITPAATPNGVCVIIVQAASTSDGITSVTYGISTGSVALARVRLDTEATEAGGVYVYWAGGGNVFPSGAQTVRIAKSAALNIRCVISTMTVAAGQQVAVETQNSGTSASVANPSWTMTTTAGVSTVCYEGIHSGLNAITSTPASGWTLQGVAEDVGNTGRGWARTTAAGGSVACGWTASTADDFVGSSIAFKEIPVPTITYDAIHVPVSGRAVNAGREASTLLNP